MTSEREPGLAFDGELLIPRLNLVAYQEIYAIEAWMRRVCLAAWMSVFSREWSSHIEDRLLRELRRGVDRSRTRLYLGTESQDDLIWASTYGQLMRLLAAGEITRAISDLTGASAEFLNSKLDEVREIRNVLAHNRALTDRTFRILSGLLASLEEAVETFKVRVLYGQSQILDDDDGWLGELLAKQLRGNDWSRFQAFVATRGPFVEFVSLPVDRNGRDHADAAALLHAFRHCLDDIVAFCVNKSGSEFLVLISAKADPAAHELACTTFAKNPSVWTATPYVDQDPRYVTSPKIWFYENQSAISAFGRTF